MSHSGTTREEVIVARLPLPSPSKGGQRPFAEIVSVPPQAKNLVPPAPAPGRVPPPPPPVAPPPRPSVLIQPSPVTSHGAGLSNVSDRIMTRLGDVSNQLCM